MTPTIVHMSVADLELNGSYEPVGDVLYLSAAGAVVGLCSRPFWV
jgi:hypothetical protein